AIINDLNKIVDKSLASTLIEGSISALNYADRLQQIIYGVFITAIITVIYPSLSKYAMSDNLNQFRKSINSGVIIILLITIPSTVGMVILAEPIVSIFYERGSFDINAKNMTSEALIFYSLGLIGMSLRSFLYRVYYAFQDTKTPLYNGFIS